MRIARVDRAIRRDCHVVGLIEVVGMEVCFDVFSVRTDQKNIMLLVVGDEHAALRIEAYRISDASFRQDREQLRLRRSGRQLSYRAGLAEIDGIQVASLVDGGAFDPKCVFAGGRDLPALKLGVLRDRGRRDGPADSKPKKE